MSTQRQGWQIAGDVRALLETRNQHFSESRHAGESMAHITGDLLNEAIELGGFSGPEYAQLRHMRSLVQRNARDDWKNAFCTMAVDQLLPHRPEISWEEILSRLAELIEAELPGAGGGGQGKGVGWQDAQTYLEGCRLKGERFTTQEEMAKRVGCVGSTINKAIAKGSIELQQWAAKQHPPSRLNVSPKAVAVALETTPQSREPGPGDVMEEPDVDVCMRFLIEQTKRKLGPEAAANAVARIQAMDPADQRALAETTYLDPDKTEQIERHREAEKQKRCD